jgi:hypothetical protein
MVRQLCPGYLGRDIGRLFSIQIFEYKVVVYLCIDFGIEHHPFIYEEVFKRGDAYEAIHPIVFLFDQSIDHLTQDIWL